MLYSESRVVVTTVTRAGPIRIALIQLDWLITNVPLRLTEQLTHSRAMQRLAILIVLLWAVALLALAQSSESGRKIVSRTDPHYPEMARQMRLQGAVKLSVLVAANGAVKSIEVLGGSPLLVRASQDAVSKWKWAPAMQETIERIELRFTPD